MTDFWLKALGTGTERLVDAWADKKHGAGRKTLDKAVMFPRRPSIARGDRIVYSAAGSGLVFAEGEVVSFPYEDDSFSDSTRRYPWWVNVRIDHRREFIHDGVPLDALSVDGRNLRKLMRRRSHVRLSPKEYRAALDALA